MLDNNLINILLIEDEEFDVQRVLSTIKPFNTSIIVSDIVSDGESAVDLIKNNPGKYNVVIMDFHLSGSLMGDKLVKQIKEIESSLQIIVITKMTINITDYKFANKLLKAGAFWYCTKYPGDIEEYIYQPTDFIISIFNANEKCLLERKWLKSNEKLIKSVEEILDKKKIIGQSAVMMNLKDEINKYADSDVNILIKGSSGTGKELVAYNIHYNSKRKFEEFVPINCGSIPNDLIESELFGYEKGAFTGADRKKPGLFEIANNGTIFLDEVTELPLPAQVKLLRVIQEGEIEKIGRTEKVKVDARIIAATNMNIEQEVREKRFREDLYYRLNVISIKVPDLRDRKEDIPLLLDYFLNQLSFKMSGPKPVIDRSGFEALNRYQWGGNVRELKNFAQRLMFIDEPQLTADHIKRTLDTLNLSDDAKLSGIESFFHENVLPLSEMEKVFREKYLRYVRDNSESDSDAARKLGLAPSNYYRMAKSIGIK